jgi:hypothetical protein
MFFVAREMRPMKEEAMSIEIVRTEAPPRAAAGPDLSWGDLYRAGGAATALFFALNFIAPIVLGFLAPQLPSSGEVGSLPSGTVTLHYISAHKAIFLLSQIVLAGPVIFLAVVFPALYVALQHLNKSYAAIGALSGIASAILGLLPLTLVFGLVPLSDQYATAATDAQRASLAAAAEGLIAQYNAVSVSGILLAVGILMFSVIMLSGVFAKWIAYLASRPALWGSSAKRLGPSLAWATPSI